ncbi:MAG: TldD/PmbA family protein [Thermoflexales bacterium]|nr:TldD/PmbA family protein [Thermoflexales bacterium]
MLGEARAQAILKQVLALSGADEAEVCLVSRDSALTRFANNVIHQNVAEANTSVTVRVAFGKRVGVATTNDVSDAGLGRAVENAQTLARLQPENPHFPGLPQPMSVEAINSFDEALAGVDAGWRARAVGTICSLANSHDLVGAGALSTGVDELAVANSHGVMAYHAATHVRLTTVVMAGSGSGYATRAGWRLGDVPVEALGQQAVDIARRAREPRSIEPGTYSVILMPYATHDMLTMLGYVGMGAQSMQEGRSWMNERLGQRLMSPGINIWDNGRDASGLPMPFDFEGLPKQRVEIVTAGVPQGPVYDTMTASREPGKRSTGHALPAPNTYGPFPLNLVMGAGSNSLGEMIRSIGRGLLVSRFWYTRVVHPRDCVITGMTRDGLFWIENGEIAYPVKNLRFTQGYVPALAGVESVGNELWTLDEDMGVARVPALHLREFTFTGATEF